MIVCSSCGKENQDLYKFCLGCGGDLSGLPSGPSRSPAGGRATPGTAPPVFADMGPTDVTDPSINSPAEPTLAKWGANGDAAQSDPAAPSDITPLPTAPEAQPMVAPAPPSSPRMCPTCGGTVPASFAFCGGCGGRVGEVKPASVSGSRPAASPQAGAHGRLVLVRPDGSEGGSHPLVDGENLIGRGAGPLFEADGYLSPRHATLVLNAAGMVIHDSGSLNGVFIKLPTEEELLDGDIFRIGQELIRFEAIPPPEPLDDGTELLGSPNPGFWGRLAVIVGHEQEGAAYPLFGDAIILGRERGDIVFPEDGYVSGTHARVSARDGRYWLSDLNSSNGTFLRIHGERPVVSGSFLLMGQQLFRVTYP